MQKKMSFVFVVAIALAGLGSTAAGRDSYPPGVIRLVTGFPSGALDAVARLLAQRLAVQMDSKVAVDTRPGFNGNVAAEYVARSKPDGHTLLVNTSSVVLGPALGEKLSYDLARDLTPVSLAASSAFVLVVNRTLPVGNVRQFIELARTHPGQLAYGSTGTGSVPHLGTLLFLQSSGLRALHVPYKGGAFVITDLLSGEIQFAFQGQSNTVPLIKAGRLKALAITSATRSTLLPDVPTLRETVMPGFELSTWIGVMAPAKMPAAIVKRLNSEVMAALQDPEMKTRLEQEGAELRGSSPEEYGAYLKSELERWAKVVKVNAIKPE